MLAISTDMAANAKNRKPKRKHSGSNCCIPGCYTGATCRGFSFPKIPKTGVSEEQDKWRAALIAEINRVDGSFNPDKSAVCSKHFEDGCIKYDLSGKCSGLVMWSMPTLQMPLKCIDTPKPVPDRVSPKSETPMDATLASSYEDNDLDYRNNHELQQKGAGFLAAGSLPTTIKPPSSTDTSLSSLTDTQKEAERKSAASENCNFDEVRLTTRQLHDSWFLISSSDSQVEVGQLKDGTVLQFKVQVQSDLTTTVSVLGLPAKHLTTSLKSLSLLSLLTKLSSWHVCPGVSDPSLQAYATLPEVQQMYFRHIICMPTESVVTHTSTVRSIKCFLLLPVCKPCLPCKEIENELKRKKCEQAFTNESTAVKLKDPLNTLSRVELTKTFKSLRKNNTRLRRQLDEFRSILDSAGEIID